MPIYEFYCASCHTVYSFFSSSVDTDARPDCPKCKRSGLERKPSRFATPRGASDDPFEGLDESRLESAFDSLAGELGDFDAGEEDPRALARVFRRLGEAAGVEPSPKLQEILARLESGADPDDLEAELDGDLDEEAGLGELFRVRKAAERRRPPAVDETLYFL